MKTLILLRHGRSGPGTPDRDRPLDAVGTREAARVGHLLVAAVPQPDLALVSDARRTRQTLAALAGWPGPVRSLLEPRLYAAPADAILALIRAVPDSEACLLVVGHNPGLGDAARQLAGDGSDGELAFLREGFPTAAAAVITVQAARWSEVESGGRLRALLLGGTDGAR